MSFYPMNLLHAAQENFLRNIFHHAHSLLKTCQWVWIAYPPKSKPLLESQGSLWPRCKLPLKFWFFPLPPKFKLNEFSQIKYTHIISSQVQQEILTSTLETTLGLTSSHYLPPHPWLPQSLFLLLPARIRLACLYTSCKWNCAVLFVLLLLFHTYPYCLV